MQLSINQSFFPIRFGNYLIAGNLANCFSLGDIGSTEDFFLTGIEQDTETNYPLITANILGPDGEVLFRLMRNNIIFNPGNCVRVLYKDGYEIHDPDGGVVMKISTALQQMPDSDVVAFVHTIYGDFYDRNKRVVLKASGGDEIEQFDPDIRCAFGFSGKEFGMCANMKDEEVQFLSIVLASRSMIHIPVNGEIEKQEFVIDGKAFINSRIVNSKIHVKTGNFALIGDNKFDGCEFQFHDQAKAIRELILSIRGETP